MKKMLLLTLATISVIIAPACQDSEFAGNIGGGASRTDNETPTSNNGNDNNTNNGNNDSPTYNNEYPNNGNNGPGENDPGKGFDIEFGKFGKVWHVGDNEWNASSCKFRLTFNRVDGKEFNFNFYVVNDGTQVNISIHHCGVDDIFAGQNPASVSGPTPVQGGQGPELARMMFQESQNLAISKKQDFPQRFTLNKGWYKVKAQSLYENPSNGDYDDFLVGNVKITGATGPLQLGEVSPN